MFAFDTPAAAQVVVHVTREISARVLTESEQVPEAVADFLVHIAGHVRQVVHVHAVGDRQLRVFRHHPVVIQIVRETSAIQRPEMAGNIQIPIQAHEAFHCFHVRRDVPVGKKMYSRRPE